MDISSLEGEALQFCSPKYRNNEVFDIVVAVADNDVGFTCVGVNNKDDNFLCYHGISSPDVLFRDTPEIWKKAKEYLLIAFELGIWDTDESEVYIYGYILPSGVMVDCAFS